MPTKRNRHDEQSEAGESAATPAMPDPYPAEMAPLPDEIIQALHGKGIPVDDVKAWREEGHVTIVIAQDGTKYRLPNAAAAAHAARVKAQEQAKQ